MQRYAITDRRLFPPEDWRRALCGQVARWVAAGVEWVQIREKDLPEADLVSLTRSLAALPRRSPTQLVVNGLAPLLAREAGSDGIHLPGLTIAAQVQEAQTLAGRVTVSCHSFYEIEQARAASAILWAPVFGKTVDGKEINSGTGLEALRLACALARPTPVFALGGITSANADSCLHAGAAGVAGIRLFHGEAWRSLARSAI